MSSYLSEMKAVHRLQFAESMSLLDKHFSPPLLWGSPKLSSWYSVGLLARRGPGDVERANKLLANCLTLQDLDESFDRNYGSFKEFMTQPNASGPNPLWAAKIYESYDPNNASQAHDSLFFTIACIIVDSLFASDIEPDLLERMHDAMHRCIKGNALREGGRFGDDMRPSYSNPFMMRCTCAAYVGHLRGDDVLVKQSDDWMDEATALWDEHDSPGEFNSPTYAGITMLAFGVAQYCPPTSRVFQTTPKLLSSLWRSIGDLYNPTLGNLAGPWDRSYGFCMSQYYTCIGTPIAALLEDGARRPYPVNLASCPHFDDTAIIPMQALLAPYVEQAVSPEVVAHLDTLRPHDTSALSFFPPHDKRPRKYTFALRDGLSVGGCDYDNDQLGGPKGEQDQFCPGVIQWDSGDHGAGCGWISVYPTSSCATMVATADGLVIDLPSSASFPGRQVLDNRVVLDISALPFLQLTGDSFADNKESLPGLDVDFAGSIAERGTRSLEFNQKTQRWGVWFYRLSFTFDPKLRDVGVPRLVVKVNKTTPPAYPFCM